MIESNVVVQSLDQASRVVKGSSQYALEFKSRDRWARAGSEGGLEDILSRFNLINALLQPKPQRDLF